MNLRQKVIIGAITVASWCGFHSANAQEANKTKAKTVNVINQVSECWLNSTDGERLKVFHNKKGVDIVDAAGNGFHVSPSGKVAFGGTELEAGDPDIRLMNTIAYMATGSALYQKHAGAVYSSDDKKVTFDEKGQAFILGAAGDKDLFMPMPSEKDEKTSQAFYENMKTQNPKLAEIAAKAIDGVSFTDLSPEARRFVSPNHYTSDEKLQAYLPDVNKSIEI